MRYLLVILFGINYFTSLGQIADPCTNGSEAACTCQGAQILCSAEDLDGYTYQMSSYSHPNDGPTGGMCFNGDGTTSHNPTWFAFAAGCPNLTLKVNFSGCNDAQPGPGTCAGLQASVYGDCENYYGSVVGCNTTGQCNSTSGSRTVTMTGLIPGKTYYFLVDGCCGSACTNVSIEVLTPPCPPSLGNWPPPGLTGPDVLCINEPGAYTFFTVTGGIRYPWYIDGVSANVTEKIENDPIASFTRSFSFSAPGMYNLCVDVYNDCVPESGSPAPLCKTITVVGPEMGTITALPTPVCPNETVTISTTGYGANTKYILIVNSAGVIVKIELGETTTFTHDMCADFTAYAYNYPVGTGTPPVLGANISSVMCGDDCCVLDMVPFSFEDDEPPVFTNPPANANYSCFGEIPPLMNLVYTDNCIPDGTVMGTEVVNYTDCAGGTLIRTWTVTDDCDNTATHVQTITLSPIPPAVLNGPASMNITCEQIPAPGVLPPLTYTNNSSGSCLISGTLIPTRVDNNTNCSGTITYTWSTTDICGRLIQHVQVLTVQPPNIAVFASLPASMTINCVDIPPVGTLPPLTYTNGSSGACLISGSAIPTRVDAITNCVGTITYTWSVTDFCGRNINHTQVLTVQAPPVATIAAAPGNMTINCVDIPPVGTLPPLNYTNGSSGTCLISGTLIPTRVDNIVNCTGTITYTWQTTDYCNRTISHTQVLTVLAPPIATIASPPASMTINCVDIPPTGTLPPLTYTNGSSGSCLISGTLIPTRVDNIVNCAGTITYTWQTTDYCNRTISHTQVLTVLPPPVATIASPPASMTINCVDIPPTGTLPPLTYTNGSSGTCLISGTLTPTRVDNIVNCAGTITFTWQTTDYCNRTISHTQVLTVLPPPVATITGAPSNMTINCPDVPPAGTLPPLNYTNGSSGACLIEGTLTPTRVDNIVNCAGTITFTWQTTDYCNRQISHTQVLTVLPPPEADFVNPPASITIDCSVAIPTALTPLAYTNNSTGSCLIAGNATPTRVENITNCMGTVTYTWSFTDQCNRQKQHVQVITVTPPAEAFPVNPPASATINCDQVPPAGVVPPLMYSNGGTGLCLIEGMMNGTRLDEIVNCAGRVTFTWTATDPCGRTINHIQILTVLPPPVVTLTNPPVYTTPITCADASTFVAPVIAYSNNSPCLVEGTLNPVVTNNYNACGGNIQISWNGTDMCNRPVTYNQIIIVQPAPPPAFTSTLPQDITVDCSNLTIYAIPLNYSNGLNNTCGIMGTVQGVLNQSTTICGGTATVTWNVTDACGNNLSHVQNITVNPAPQASFVNPPPPTSTVACGGLPFQLPTLSYTNNATGSCLISGTVTAVQTGSYDACGGTVQYTWQFTDACGRSIVYNQNITVLPSSNPVVFINPPADENLPCGVGFGTPPVLSYSNGLSGICGINGTANPITQDFGTNRVYTWSFIHPCTNAQIEHVQTVTIVPEPNIVLNPSSVTLCEGQTFDLSTILVTDLNGQSANLFTSYHTGSPATSANEITNPIIIASLFQNSYVIKVTNEFGCSDEEIVIFNVTTQIGAGDGSSGNECKDGTPVSLWDYLFGNYDINGYWVYLGSENLNIDDPFNVNFSEVPAGDYEFQYIVPGLNGCPDDEATILISVVAPGDYFIESVNCSGDLLTYTIQLIALGYQVETTAGTVVSNGGGSFTITNIPIAQGVTLTFSNSGSNCSPQTVDISAPTCGCPNINPPTNNGNVLACQNSQNVTLSVTQGAGLSVNWYSLATGGTLLLANSNTYSPSTATTGIFTFFAEAIDLVTNCKSNTRTQVRLEVVANPNVMNAILRTCDDNADGFAEFNLDDIKTSVNANPANVITFHINNADALTGANPLPTLYTNTVVNQTIFASVRNNNGCISVAQVQLVTINPPTFNTVITSISCVGAQDGAIEVISTGTNTYRLNNLPWTSSNIFENLGPGTYSVSVRNEDLCISTASLTIVPGQSLSVASYSIICENNGTASISTDDIYEVTFTIASTINVSNQFEVFFNNVSQGLFNYNVSSTITLPANGMGGLLEFIDVVSGCETSRVVGSLIPCSTDCEIVFSGLTVVCSDNGTESDGTDDFYTISLTAQASNGSNTNTFNILVNDVIVGTYSYGTVISFQLPADGQVPTVVIRDADDLQCIENVAVNALTPCSASCVINSTITNILCNDNGTINDPADDLYTFDIRVTGLNISSGWFIQGDPQLRTYNATHRIGPFLISGGDFNEDIFDSVDNNCLVNVTVEAPAACSEPCVLRVDNLLVNPCNDNGTGDDDTDDVFDISFSVSRVSGSVNFYNVTDGTTIYGPYTYGQTVTISNLSANGSTITLSVYDGINSGCTQTIVVSQPSCSSCTQTVDAGADITLTCIQNTATLTATSSQPGVYTWTGPNGFLKTGQSVTTTTPGVYTVTVIYPDNCTATDIVEVFKDGSLPVSNAGLDQSITCNVTSVTLSGTSNLSTNVQYVWTNSSGSVVGNTQNITVTEPGLYYFEVINLTNNCSSGQDEVEVIDDTEKPIAIIFADPSNLIDCIIGTVVLSGQPQDNVIFNWIYTENNVQNQNSVIIDFATIVTMTAIDTLSGCSNSSMLEIIDLQDYPILVITPPLPITCTTNETTIIASDSPQGPNLVFEWYNSNNVLIPGANSSTLNVNMPGVYYVVLTDTLNGCSNRDTIDVGRIGDFPEISVSEDKTLYCGATNTSLDVNIINPLSAVNIVWNSADGNILNGTNTQSIQTQGAGTYSVQVTYPISGCMTTEDIIVNINNNVPEAVVAVVEDESCVNDRNGSIDITTIEGGEEPYQLSLNGATNPRLDDLPPGEYLLGITDANGCPFDTTFTIEPGNQFELSTISPLEIIASSTQILEVKTNLDPTLIASVIWSPSTNLSCDTCLVTTLTAREAITYTVTVTDIYGCVEEINVVIRLRDNTIVTIPNVINVNGDQNSFFTIYGNEGLIAVKKLSVFDRWGNLIFLKENFPPNIPQEGWNGKFNNTDVVPGVYVYSVEYITTGGEKTVAGDITVIR